MDIRNAAVGFSFGVVVAHWLPTAHPLWVCWFCAGVMLMPVRRAQTLGAALIGLAWGAVNATDALDRRIGPGCAEATLVGRVVDLPAAIGHAGGVTQRFVVEPERSSCEIGGNVRLSWRDGPGVGAGEVWRLHVRLKAPRANANRHGFDAEAWLARDKLAATGYVLRGTRVSIEGSTRIGGIDGPLVWRGTLRERLGQLPLVNAGVIAALTLGDRTGISSQQADLYRRTGTMHLLVISGLHVGIVTALGFLLGRGAGTVAGISARSAGVVTALLFAAGYVLVAGAGMSLVRAFTMSVAGMVALLAGRSAAPSVVFAYALAVVLAIDPMAPLGAGFWLSFGAVAVLLAFFAPRRRRRSWLVSAVLAQLAIATVFVPATTGITGLVHPLGIGVNLVVVPAVTLLVVPLSLAGVALIATPWGGWLLAGADFSVSVVEQVLARADQVAPFYVADPGPWLAWLVATAAASLSPVSRLAAAALATTVAMLLVLPRTAVPPGQVDLEVLDVGQGTAVLLETANHTLIYDTGPSYLTGGDAGSGVVLPSLRGRGWRRVDRLVLSHGDLDHIGGATSVIAGARVVDILSGEAVPGIEAGRCHTGLAWHWDDVAFSILGPQPDSEDTGNNASCVLLIETAAARVLLAGDIGATVEARLDLPPVDVLLVPHHGSLTSSTAGLVATTRPSFAVVAAGFDNRFGHPHPDVVDRYRRAGSHIVSTGLAGAVAWTSVNPHVITVQRCENAPYWRGGAGTHRAASMRCEWHSRSSTMWSRWSRRSSASTNH